MAEGHQDFPFSVVLHNGKEIELREIGVLSSDTVKVWVAQVEESWIRHLQIHLTGMPGLKVAVYSLTSPVRLDDQGKSTFQPIVVLGREVGRKYGEAGVFASLWLHANHDGQRYTAQVVYGSGQRVEALVQLAMT